MTGSMRQQHKSEKHMSDSIQNYLNDFEQIQSDDWFTNQRQSALSLFKENGFPSTRLENWKYTDVKTIARKSFSNIALEKVIIDKTEIDEVRFNDLNCIELVFVNGVYSGEHSKIDELPEGVTIDNLADALTNDDGAIENHLNQYADSNVSPFTALNTAFIQHGTYINIPKGTVIDRPINLLYLAKAESKPFATHPRNLIILAENAQATVIESYIGIDNADYFTNVVSEVFLSDNAVLKHYKFSKRVHWRVM